MLMDPYCRGSTHLTTKTPSGNVDGRWLDEGTQKVKNRVVCPLCVVVSGKERKRPGYDEIMRLSDHWNFGFRSFRGGR
jgi:hypothetical protein